jgi:hypothetical protein
MQIFRITMFLEGVYRINLRQFKPGGHRVLALIQ